MMLNSAIGNLAVVDEKNTLLGVVSFDTVRDVLAEQEQDAENEDSKGEDGSES